VTEYIYDDPEHPERPTRAIHSPEYTVEDRALLLGLSLYESRRCQCGEPRERAWHSEMDGWYVADEFVCLACSARQGREVAYTVMRDESPADMPLPPFVLGKTTVEPERKPT